MKELHIAIDTREQQPVHHYQGKTVNGCVISYEPTALETFDYCVHGDWVDMGTNTGKTVRPLWAIERKSVADFIGSFFNAANRKREAAKIMRAKAAWGGARPIVYVIEGNGKDISGYDYNRFPSGSVTPRAVMSRISSLRYGGIQVILCEGRRYAEYTILGLLKRRAEELKREERRK